jgi:hypothetical protein
MNHRVIVLAQGSQRRLGIEQPKSTLPLPACGDVPIVARTIYMLDELFYNADAQADVELVCWPTVSAVLAQRMRGILVDLSYSTLEEPGNSSLKGISRFLACTRGLSWPPSAGHDVTSVLFGDCVYSWDCLRKIVHGAVGHWFVVSPDISRSGGELWGLSWRASDEQAMLGWLEEAIEFHPPFVDYQPGQMRRWMHRALTPNGQYECHAVTPEAIGVSPHVITVGDYTMDIDLPQHLQELDRLSIAAKNDDIENGM